MAEIDCFVIEGDQLDAEMWEISENLHRAEMTVLQRDEQVARWVELAEARVVAQLAPKPQGGRPESGVRAAAREIGAGRMDASRAGKVLSQCLVCG